MTITYEPQRHGVQNNRGPRRDNLKNKLSVALALFLCASVARTSLAAGQACDRACLRPTLDAYLNAVVKHDPAAAPLMVGFRQTENAIVVRPGNGVWKSV